MIIMQDTYLSTFDNYYFVCILTDGCSLNVLLIGTIDSYATTLLLIHHNNDSVTLWCEYV